MKKYFVYYDSGSKGHLCYGPYFVGQFEAVGGKKFYHSEEDMLKMGFSPTIEKRIQKAKPGSHIRLHGLHSTGDFMTKCIGEDEIPALDDAIKLNSEIDTLQKKTAELKKQYQKTSSRILQ